MNATGGHEGSPHLRGGHKVGTGPKGVIWDVDGTLIDSGHAHWQSWRVILADADMDDLPYETFVTWFGRRNDDIMREHFRGTLSFEEAMVLARRKEAHYLEGLRADGTPIPPGVQHWLDRLAAAGWKLGIGTSAPMQNIEIILEQSGWLDTFDAIVTKDDVRHGKPNPEVFLKAAARMGVSPERAIVIEDSAHGVLGAHRAGMRSIGVGIHHDELGAMLAVPTLDLLPHDAFDRLLDEPVPSVDPAWIQTPAE
jgi:beta-phosphoglucomutase